MSDESTELLVISMPTDDDQVIFLFSKLNTYRRRAEEQGLAYKAPEAMNRDEIDTDYKIYILNHLVENGTIYLLQISAALAGPNGLDTEVFNNAWRVIHDYATTGGQEARAGKSWNPPPKADPPS